MPKIVLQPGRAPMVERQMARCAFGQSFQRINHAAARRHACAREVDWRCSRRVQDSFRTEERRTRRESVRHTHSRSSESPQNLRSIRQTYWKGSQQDWVGWTGTDSRLAGRPGGILRPKERSVVLASSSDSQVDEARRTRQADGRRAALNSGSQKWTLETVEENTRRSNAGRRRLCAKTARSEYSRRPLRVRSVHLRTKR